jgi:hypothetical protein
MSVSVSRFVISSLLLLCVIQWRISNASTAGGESPRLYIKSRFATKSFSVRFDVTQAVAQIPFLRFYVCFDDAVKLLGSPVQASGLLPAGDRRLLQKYIRTVKSLRKIVPKTGMRHTVALLGQTVLNAPDVVSMQLGPCIALLHLPGDELKTLPTPLSVLQKKLMEIAEKAISEDFPEFHDLVDTFHEHATTDIADFDFHDGGD